MSRPYPCVYCTEDGFCKKYSDEEVTSWCIQGPCKDEKPSNADRIRSMTDKELAEWIVHKTEGNGFDGYKEVVNAWLNWLKEEVANEAD